MFCAARCASGVFSKIAKQVAPEPDIRASQAPLVALSAASTSRITGWMRIAGASRSLEFAASTSAQSSIDAPSSGQAVAWSTSANPTNSSPFRKPSAANTSLVATGARGLTSTQGIIGKLSGSSVSPTPVMSQAREARQTGTSEPVSFATSIRRGSSVARPFARASSRSAAAASAEPPPIPAATGSTLSRVNSPSLRLGTRSPSKRGSGRKRQAVGAIGKRNHAFQVVIAVDPASDHPEGQIDLGAPFLNQPRHWRPALRSPALAVFFFLVRGSGGGSVLRQPVFKLGFDLGQLFRLGFQVAGMSPLEFCFQRAADAPISVAEMIVDSRILRLEIDRTLQMFHRVFVVADAVIGPAERIHDVTIVRALLDGPLDHLHALVEIDALID